MGQFSIGETDRRWVRFGSALTVYIGQKCNARQRFNQHRSSGGKIDQFASKCCPVFMHIAVRIPVCDRRVLDRIERQQIGPPDRRPPGNRKSGNKDCC
jgi:hypothetical protein